MFFCFFLNLPPELLNFRETVEAVGAQGGLAEGGGEVEKPLWFEMFKMFVWFFRAS